MESFINSNDLNLRLDLKISKIEFKDNVSSYNRGGDSQL